MIFLSLILIFLTSISQQTLVGWDQKVKEYVFNKSKVPTYNQHAFPSDSQITLQVSVAIQGLTAVDEISSLIRMKIVLRQKWNDPRLQWDPAQFNDLKTVSLNYEANKIWVPDTSSWNLNSKYSFPTLDEALIHLNYDGAIYWSRPGYVVINKKFKYNEYPFDTQDIDLILESWAYPSSKLKVIPWIKQPGKYRVCFEEEAGKVLEHLQWDIKDLNCAKISFDYAGGIIQLYDYKYRSIK